MLWRQSPRNRRIADACAKCGLVERSGQGANRMFEESIKEGTRKGTLHALAVTGAVITSAGVVLAATFSGHRRPLVPPDGRSVRPPA